MILTEATGSPLLGEVAARGAAVVVLDRAWSQSPEALRDAAAASPFTFAARLLGVEPLLVERQPIRPVPGARSFAASREVSPLHTDSQTFLDMPPAVQVLVCVYAAARGGESLLVDGERLATRLAGHEPALASALFATERVQRFYFGERRGPTLALHRGHLAWTYAPRAEDVAGRALAAEVAREPLLTHALRPGEALVASNHRMLHGRSPFEGERELVRLLVWLEQPLAADPQQTARARTVSPPLGGEAVLRLRAVLAILRGVPPARVAHDAGVGEATLYAWRDAFVRGGAPALGLL